MKTLSARTTLGIGFTAGVWVMFLFMRGQIMAELQDASMIAVRNEMLDGMMTIGFLVAGLTLLVCVLIMTERMSRGSKKRK